MDYVKLSKEISYALRHAPWEYELELDAQGFVPVEQLLWALNEGEGYDRTVTIEDVRHVIDSSEKQRHKLVDDKICALYGHTVPGRVVREEMQPPPVLFHGTPRKSLDAIWAKGLLPMKRQYVHMSTDVQTALRVGRRRDAQPAVLQIDARRAASEGISFFWGNDKVWLAETVPAVYLSELKQISDKVTCG